MPDTKITDLSTLTGADAASSDVTVVVDVSDPTMSPTSGTNKKMTLDELAAAVATKLGVVGRDILWDAKGDLAVGTGANAAGRLAVGAVGTVPVSESSASTGIAWGYPQISPPALGPSGTLAETGPRYTLTTTGSVILNSGRLQLCAIYLPKDLLITSITLHSNTTTNTPTNQWFGLFNSSRNILRLTNDDTTTAWSSGTAKTLALSSTFTTTYAGLHYIGVCVVATGPPQLYYPVGCTGAGPLNTAPIFAGHSSTGLTTPASCPDPAGAITGGFGFYAYLT